ncbi:hypothetical protein RQP53_02845 [Paucibacter sp. APW11]|uniref:RecC C-terminal domain-containing protein n=1 Tax=Roseateles aquae TaxID=3077235 RepID=A0ABU3P6L1_9BURK|nr:hypothetical protein [Paucibacter sp. APW11]MDT8998208.1 hypothetical protein [Paucibacter sp. APW11]
MSSQTRHALQDLPLPGDKPLPQQRALSAPQRLARLPAAREQRDPLGFDALREAALQLAQGASRQQWTDYNLHDPGVTLLEALCYALSEDIFACRQSVPELLGLLADDAGDDPNASISDAALQRHALYGRRDALPCRPSTAADYQRWLYDLWPEARHLRIRALRDHAGRASGLWQLSRQAQQADVNDQQQALAQTSAYWAARNLGEDLLDVQQLLKPRWVSLRCRLRVDGQRDLAELLAELLARCDDYIAARPLRRAVAEQPDARRSGPLMGQGWVSRRELERCQADELKFNDLALYLRDTVGVLDVDELRLEESAELRMLSSLDGDPTDPEGPQPLLRDANSLPMRGAGWALRLAWPSRPEDLEGWQVSGQGSSDQLPLQQLWQQLEDVRRTPRRLALPELAGAPGRDAREARDTPPAYVAASSHLPEVYRHPGRHGASLELRSGSSGQRLQWHAYLALLEQWLAHSRAQRQHLGELFDIGRAMEPSYWWDLPGNAQLPGLDAVAPDPMATLARPQAQAPGEGLYLQPRAQLERDLFATADDAIERRSRVLDQLLAMHGEGLDFQPLQGLPCYWSAPSWRRHLLRCKQRYARQLPLLTRDRAAAFDYSQPMLGRRDNRSPLALRLALQLGMAHPFPRLLTPALEALGLQLIHDDRPASGEPPMVHADAQHEPLHLLPGSRPPRRGAELRASWQLLRRHLPRLRDPLPAALLRSAVYAERYVLQHHQGILSLLLTGESRGQQWQLAKVNSSQQALQLATELHHLACALQRHAEGLHLVEHLLLRPPGHDSTRLDGLHRAKLSLLLPGWTARGADARFQALCRDALLMAAPAHLESRVFFLQAEDMAEFERLYAGWLQAKETHCKLLQRGALDGPMTEQLAQQAAALTAFLRPLWARPEASGSSA